MTNHHSSQKQVLAKKTTRLSLISTPNTLFCNSCALFAYGLSQHDPPASPKLELFSRSASLTGKPASTVLRPRAATRAFWGALQIIPNTTFQIYGCIMFDILLKLCHKAYQHIDNSSHGLVDDPEFVGISGGWEGLSSFTRCLVSFLHLQTNHLHKKLLWYQIDITTC